MSDVKYCPNCGTEVKEQDKFCLECGYKLSDKPSANIKRTSSKKPERNNKRTLSILIIVLIIAVVSLTAFSYYNSHGDVDSMKFSLIPHKIAINSVDSTGGDTVNSDDYKGYEKSYKVTYTAKEDLKDVTIEVYPYSSDGKELDVMANFFGLNALNVLCYDDNITSGTSKTADVMFGHKGSGDFKVSYLKVFVYKENSNGNRNLIDKFTYNLNS